MSRKIIGVTVGTPLSPSLITEKLNDAGYATKEYVQGNYQPKGTYLSANELPNAINTALAQAKESGEFDGKDGDDYVLTPADKTEIAEIAAGMVDVPEHGGDYSETVFVKVTQNSDESYSIDMTFAELLEAYENKNNIVCLFNDNGAEMHIPFIGYVVDEGISLMFFSTALPYASMYVIIADYTYEAYVYVERIEQKSLSIKIGNHDQIVYNGIDEVSIDIPAVKNPYPLTVNGVSYDGSETVNLNLEAVGVDAEAVNELIDTKLRSVLSYGAVGDGSTDDTAAFQEALAENRTVTVPGGTYNLSGTLVIGENCCLELSQDTVLQFTQTSGNCIDMRASATLRGNHAIISVPYAFTGNVVAIDTNLETGDLIIPPYKKIGSHNFKRQRFVYDVNIIKPDASGFCRSDDGNCNGTAIHIHADSTVKHMWLWALTLSGIRIAGGFSYGIRAYNIDSPVGSSGHYEDDAWNHDMRIEAVIEACEIGVALENCNGAHLEVTVQPCLSQYNSVKYARYGVYLNDSRFIDMSGSRVWDWNDNHTLYTPGGQYQHLAMIGNCRGLILDDFLYYETSADIRSLIYTDTASNLEKMTILQEPVTRWFKPEDGEPYFFDGHNTKRLALKTDIDEYFQTDRVQAYTDVKSPYQENVYDNNGTLDTRTGNLYIEPKAFSVGDVIRIRGLDFTSNYPGQARAYLYDKTTGAYKGLVNLASLISQSPTGSFYNDEATYEWNNETKTLTVVFSGSNAASFLNAYKYAFGGGYASGYTIDNVVMTINEEIKFAQVGFLADNIKVKGENVIGGTSGGGISVTGATVGQTVKIAEVDENGVPTAWEAVDFPSGGGVSWKKVVDYTLTENATEITINRDADGNPFSLVSAAFIVFIVSDANNASGTVNFWVYIDSSKNTWFRGMGSYTGVQTNNRQIAGHVDVFADSTKYATTSFGHICGDGTRGGKDKYFSYLNIVSKTDGFFFPAGTRITIAGIPAEGGNGE